MTEDSGARIVLFGAAGAGKSSLLGALAQAGQSAQCEAGYFTEKELKDYSVGRLRRRGRCGIHLAHISQGYTNRSRERIGALQ